MKNGVNRFSDHGFGLKKRTNCGTDSWILKTRWIVDQM